MKQLIITFIAFYLTLVFLATPSIASDEHPIKVNQLGFYPDAEKIAVVPDGASGTFEVYDTENEQVAYTGELDGSSLWWHSSENVAIADFSGLSEPGTYRVEHEGSGVSHEFQIDSQVLRDVSRASIRAYYFNRASIELEEEYAGQWARPMGHPDDEVMVHPSAATDQRPEGYTFSSAKGWYDAGDFNKYIVNSGISTYTLMAAYEHFPEYYEDLSLNIPESDSDQPDLLDEIRWNLDWMITMQDPDDGGVYHKLTAPNFEGVIMPHQADSDRFVVQKSTAAALNFAAVMAAASRVYDEYDSDFAAEALEAAEYAWEWAEENPEVYYNQDAMNEEYHPNINTGEYGDTNLDDEFDWAAAELYISTGNDDYWNARDFESAGNGIPVWQNVRPLAWVSLAHHKDDLTDAADEELIRERIISQGDDLVNEYESSAYRVSMGMQGNNDFVWGSNGTAANHSVMLLQAYRLTEDATYLDAAQSNLDYLFGRNATGYSFVTGYGGMTPMDPHHRQSAADDNPDPVPGFLVGGPQASQQDGCDYPSDRPAKSYLDEWCSYSTNEVTINWNAPLVYITGAIDHFKGDEVVSSPTEIAPPDFEVKQNYPNPFNPATSIEFTLSEPADVQVEVFTATGEKVALVDEGRYDAGHHQLRFNAEDLASGVYLYRVRAGAYTATRQMTFIK